MEPPDPHTPVEDRNGGDGAPGHDDGRVDALLELTRANVRLYRRLRHAGEEVHDGAAPPAAARGVLRELYRGGPRTVPQIARTWPVSRQHIQALVNDLLDEGLVETRPNPAHKRSHLIALTDAGAALVEELVGRERRVLAELGTGIDVDRLRTAAEVLERLRLTLSSDEWEAALEDAGVPGASG